MIMKTFSNKQWWKSQAKNLAHTTKALAGSARYGFPTANLECIGIVGSKAPQVVSQLSTLLRAAEVANYTVHVTKDLISHAETSLQQELASLSAREIATVLFLLDEDVLTNGALNTIAFNVIAVAEQLHGDELSPKALQDVIGLCKRAHDACVLNVDSSSFRVLQPICHGSVYTYGQSDLADVRLTGLSKGVAIQYDDAQIVLQRKDEAKLITAAIAKAYNIDLSLLKA
jgi:hypothetical protein